MIPYIMVEPKQWSEMIQAMEENTRLKAEVERLKAQFSRLESVDENELGLTVPRRLVLFWMYRAKRLYKAGDAMSEVIQTIDHERFECYPQYRMTTKERNACDAWNAAKEGKSSV